MKYLLLFLGLLINLFFFSFSPTKAKADDCTGKRPGDSCGAYIKNIDETTCQTCYGRCTADLSCDLSVNDCSNSYTCSGPTNPTPTINPSPSVEPSTTPPPGETITPFPTSKCPPSAVTDPTKGNTKYVQDKSLTDDELLARVAGQALVPEIVRQDADSEVPTKTKTSVDVTKSFFGSDNNILSSFFGYLTKIICGLTGSYFCTPNISLGGPDLLDTNNLSSGTNTPHFAAEARVLGSAAIPQGMELTAENKDCNIGNLGTETDPGNQNIDDLSENLGTTTGFYGNGIPDFKTLTPNDWETLINDQMKKENLNIGSKLFGKDKRSPDIYLRKQVACKGLFPNGICPFEPTPTP